LFAELISRKKDQPNLCCSLALEALKKNEGKERKVEEEEEKKNIMRRFQTF
jgi:hypothetical protein